MRRVRPACNPNIQNCSQFIFGVCELFRSKPSGLSVDGGTVHDYVVLDPVLGSAVEGDCGRDQFRSALEQLGEFVGCGTRDA